MFGNSPWTLMYIVSKKALAAKNTLLACLHLVLTLVTIFITLKMINGYAVDVYAWGYMALQFIMANKAKYMLLTCGVKSAVV